MIPLTTIIPLAIINYIENKGGRNSMAFDSESFISNIIYNRFCEVEGEVLKNNEKYIEVEKKYSKLFHEIERFLPKEHKELMYQFDKAIGLQIGIASNAMYEQGFKDGIELKKIVG